MSPPASIGDEAREFVLYISIGTLVASGSTGIYRLALSSGNTVVCFDGLSTYCTVERNSKLLASFSEIRRNEFLMTMRLVVESQETT